MPDRALLIVDVQNDFCPGGALGVRAGDEIVPVLNRYAERFHDAELPVIASRDWHPARTTHFKAWGGPWPPHCVAGTPGAAFHPDLRLPEHTIVVSKGTDPEAHGYSAFDARTPGGEGVAALLDGLGVRTIYMGGLATDYCVLNTVLDARRHGLDAVILLDAVRGIDVEKGDVARALDRMLRAGARTATLETIGEELGPGAEVGG